MIKETLGGYIFNQEQQTFIKNRINKMGDFPILCDDSNFNSFKIKYVMPLITEKKFSKDAQKLFNDIFDIIYRPAKPIPMPTPMGASSLYDIYLNDIELISIVTSNKKIAEKLVDASTDLSNDELKKLIEVAITNIVNVTIDNQKNISQIPLSENNDIKYLGYIGKNYLH